MKNNNKIMTNNVSLLLGDILITIIYILIIYILITIITDTYNLLGEYRY